MTSKEQLEQLKAEIQLAIEKFETGTGLRVQPHIEIHRHGSTASVPDKIFGIYLSVN